MIVIGHPCSDLIKKTEKKKSNEMIFIIGNMSHGIDFICFKNEKEKKRKKGIKDRIRIRRKRKRLYESLISSIIMLV